MTTATDIVTAGFRENNLIPVGSSPSAAEKVEGLQVLNRYLNSTYGYVIGESLTEWPVPAIQRTGSVAANPPLLPGSAAPLLAFNRAYPPANSRIVWDGSTQTVYFPENPDDGARMALVKASGAASGGVGTLTLDGNGRTIEGADTYTLGATGRAWFYRADLADWKALVDLEIGDAIPFPTEYDDYWICGLAIRLSPRYGKQVGVGTVETFKRLKSSIQARYTQEAPGTSGGALLHTGDQSYQNGWYDFP